MHPEKMESNIITIIGDSLSMVRPEDGILYPDTYVFKLQNFLGPDFHVVQRSKRLNDVCLQANNLEDDVLNNKSRIVIFQLGIVDCAPRLFGRNEHLLLSFMGNYPVLKNVASFIIRFKSRNRLFWTRNFPKTYVSKDIFKEKLEYIIDQVREKSSSKILLINIADTNNKNKKRSYNYENNINDYNEIIKEVASNNSDICKLVDFYQFTVGGKLILEDGIHITKEGHELLAELLYQKIKEFEKNEGK